MEFRGHPRGVFNECWAIPSRALLNLRGRELSDSLFITCQGRPDETQRVLKTAEEFDQQLSGRGGRSRTLPSLDVEADLDEIQRIEGGGLQKIITSRGSSDQVAESGHRAKIHAETVC